VTKLHLLFSTMASKEQTLERLRHSISNALSNLDIPPPQLSVDSLDNDEILSLVQRLCDELSLPTGVPSTLHDAISAAYDLGFDAAEGTDTNIAIAELIYFLAIELQAQGLRDGILGDSSPVSTAEGKAYESKTTQYLDTTKLRESARNLSNEHRQMLDSLEEALRQDYENRAVLIASRLKVTAASFIMDPDTTEPLGETQEQLQSLIQSIQSDDFSLLPLCKENHSFMSNCHAIWNSAISGSECWSSSDLPVTSDQIESFKVSCTAPRQQNQKVISSPPDATRKSVLGHEAKSPSLKSKRNSRKRNTKDKSRSLEDPSNCSQINSLYVDPQQAQTLSCDREITESASLNPQFSSPSDLPVTNEKIES